MKKEIKKDKKENKTKRKYEFKSEKNKKMIVNSIIIGLGIAAIVFGLSLGGYKLYGTITGEGITKNAAPTCRMPYSNYNCRSAKNASVIKIQEMLNKLGYLKKSRDYNDGNFGPKTKQAVTDFQKSQKTSADGIVGPDTLTRLATKAGVDYYTINYNKNGGYGNLDSTYNNKQVIIAGVSTNISSTILTTTGQTLVGYSAKRVQNGKVEAFGCYSQKCDTTQSGLSSTPQWYETKTLTTSFNSYMYSPGTVVAWTAWNRGEVTFLAQYCNNGYYFDKATNKCTLSNSSGGKYSVSSSQYNKLVAVVCGEDDTGYTGAKAVIDNIFNRVDSKSYPNTTWGVVTARSQYEAYYNSKTFSKRLNQVNGSGCKGAKQAVKDAMSNPGNRSHTCLSFKYRGSGRRIGDNVYYNCK